MTTAADLGITYALTVRVPQLKPATLNSREHFMVKARRVRRERLAVALALHGYARPRLVLENDSVVVTLTRCSPGTLDDDNAVGSMKACRDQVAAWLGVDDRDPRVTWKVEQRKVKRAECGVLIRVEGKRG